MGTSSAAPEMVSTFRPMLRPLRALSLLIVLAFGKAEAAVATCATPDRVTTSASPSSGAHEGCPPTPGDPSRHGSVPNHQRADCAAMLSCQTSPSLPAAPAIALRAAVVCDQTGVRVIPPVSRARPPASPPPRA
jgi:hypothetical protein